MTDASGRNINTREYWDTVYRREWETGEVSSSDYQRDYGPIHDAIVALAAGGSRVLDIACGAGVLCRKLKQTSPAASVTGVDFSRYTVERNHERDAALGIEYLCLDVREELPSLGGPFDVVILCEIIEHLDDPAQVLADAFRLLRDGGRLIVTCPHDDAIPDPEHVRLWGHDEIFHALAPYTSAVSLMHFPPPYFDMWLLATCLKEGRPVQVAEVSRVGRPTRP